MGWELEQESEREEGDGVGREYREKQLKLRVI